MCLCENDFFFFFFNTPTYIGKRSEVQAFIFQVILDKSNDRWSSVESDSNKGSCDKKFWIAKHAEHWKRSEVCFDTN